MEKKDQEKVQPIQSVSNLKSYYCPFCQKFLMKGDVKRLNMTCPNCQKLINKDEKELLKPDIMDEKDV